MGGLVTPGGAVKMVGYGAKAVKAAGKTMAKVSKNVTRKAVVVVVKESSENVLKIGCFVAGTLVWTPDGSIPIDSLKEGVLVQAYDTEGKNITTERVELAYSRRVDRLVAVKFGDQKILTTPEHPFYVRNGWLEAIDLKAGDTLFTTFADPVVISEIRMMDTTVQVFNVTVSNQHNYFVGSERVLVHNNNPCAQAVNSGTKGAAKGGMTELQLVTRAAQKAETAIGGSGGVAGTLKHTYAKNLLSRYQSRFGGDLSLGSNYFNNNALLGAGNRGFLDVVNHNTKTIYDFKFGNAFMSNSQYLKYSRNYQGYGIQIIKP